MYTTNIWITFFGGEGKYLKQHIFSIWITLYFYIVMHNVLLISNIFWSLEWTEKDHRKLIWKGLDVLSNIYFMRCEFHHAIYLFISFFSFMPFHLTMAPFVSHHTLDVHITVLFSCHYDKVDDRVCFFERPILRFYLSERMSEPLLCLSHSSCACCF